MTTRDEFLSRLRRRLAAGAPASIAHPMRPVDGVPEIVFRDRTAAADPVEAFCAAAEGLGCEVRRPHEDLAACVAQIRDRHALTSAVVSEDPEARPVADALAAAGVVVAPASDRQACADAGVGVAGAEWAIATTGTLVVQCARAGSRTVSLLPPVLVAVVRPEAIMQDASQLLRRIDERYPDGLPSQLVFVTGPSRSADIELQLTVGVHGPGAVWILVR